MNRCSRMLVPPLYLLAAHIRCGQMLSLLLLLVPICVAAQTSPSTTPSPTPVTYVIPKDTTFKVKLVRVTSSSTARNYDYVEFQVMENVLSPLSPDGPRKILIEKGAPAFGYVTQAKHRRFPFRGGKLKVILKEVKAVDGTPVSVYLSRFDPCTIPGVYPGLKCPAKLDCQNPKGKPFSSEPCISGRRNATVAPVVPAVATGGAVLVKDSTAKALAILTLLSDKTIGDLLNGVDAALDGGDIFDAYVIQPASVTLWPAK